jgi:hypothetical protein
MPAGLPQQAVQTRPPGERFSPRIRSLVLPSHRPGPGPSPPADRFNSATERHPQTPDASAEVLREAEQLVSRQRDRLHRSVHVAPTFEDQ